MTTEPIVRLKPKKAGPFFGRHPWVLDTAIDSVDGHPAAGDVVSLTAENGDFIARGIFNPRSRIRVRLYTWDRNQSLDREFWQGRIQSAGQLRKALWPAEPPTACRLVNSEADLLSGLIVDRFGDYLVVQPTAYAIWQRLDEIGDLLMQQFQPAGILVHLDTQLSRREGIEAGTTPTWGAPPSEPLTIIEHGLKYQVDLQQSQKTGFYLDQSVNRLAVSRYLAGRRVADVCCYTGGFSIAAEKLGNAASVIGVDTSRTAIQAAQHHAQWNDCQNVQFEVGDCFQWLDAAVERGESFSAVILDPPKFATGRSGLRNALRAYHRLNLQAIKCLEPGGILVTCSCTGSVRRDDFSEMLHGVAVRAGRPVQILDQRGAAPDHPVATHCRENEYLKCFICRVPG